MANQIKYGAIISYLSLFLNILIGLIYTPWMINSIGKADYGLYTLAMSIIGLLAFDFGLGNATTKFVTQYLAENRQDKIDNLLGLIYKFYFIVDAIILIALICMYHFLPQVYTALNPEELERFSIVFIIASAYCVISFPFIPLNGILNSYEKFIQLKTCDLISRVITIASMAICLWAGYGLYALVVVNSVVGLITVALKLYIVKTNTPVKVNIHYYSKDIVKEVISFTLWVTITALAQRLIFNISPSILGIFADSQSIAILGIAITLENYVYLFANALNGMFLPKVSRLTVKNAPECILGLMIKIGRIQIIIIGFIIIWLASYGKDFISVWIGDGYSLVYPCVLLICLPSFFHLPQEIGLTYIIAANKVKLQAYIYLIMGIVNILLSIPLTVKYGVIGMCLSIFIAYMIRTIGLDIVFYKVLKIDIISFFKKSYLSLLPSLFLCLIISLTAGIRIKTGGWNSLILKSIICLISYVFFVYSMGLDKSERKIIRSQILKRN